MIMVLLIIEFKWVLFEKNFLSSWVKFFDIIFFLNKNEFLFNIMLNGVSNKSKIICVLFRKN